jgi:hypothetical protein
VFVAFPSLHVLGLHGVNIADGSLFFNTNALRVLRSLSCGGLEVQEGAVPAIAAALGSLPTLKDLHLDKGVPAGFAAQVTGLTHLLMVTDTQ